MPIDMDSTIKEMVNVGVTAKLASPLYHLSAALQSSSTTTETEFTHLHSKYKKFLNEKTSTQTEDTLDNSKSLYQLKSLENGALKVTPSKFEFLLYRKPSHNRRLYRKSNKSVRLKKSHTSIKRLIESESKSEATKQPAPPPLRPPPPPETSFVEKLRKSLGSMGGKKKKTKATKTSPSKPKPPKESRIDIYPFDHGCAEYLRTTDFAPQLISEMLAERATDYATRFWAEFFGSLHIGVAFVLTFFLQTYRFLLYSLVKSIIVGFLQMSSDYAVKPLLTVTFNGFIQPVLIFVHNVLSSMRDVLKPVAETMDSFLKPVGNLLKSIRLVTFKDRRSNQTLMDV